MKGDNMNFQETGGREQQLKGDSYTVIVEGTFEINNKRPIYTK
jgi:hypothetical protein